MIDKLLTSLMFFFWDLSDSHRLLKPFEKVGDWLEDFWIKYFFNGEDFE